MPNRNGYEVFEGVRATDPGTKVILMTAYGYDPTHSIVRASEEGLCAVLYKPFLGRLCGGAGDLHAAALQRLGPRRLAAHPGQLLRRRRPAGRASS